MAKQLQLRRGTTVQNDAFTGAIGELTMDTDKKQLRLHDGATQGGCGLIDPVVAFQKPTAENGYKWYRKYASGWVEQGGVSTLPDVTFPITMADTNYFCSCLPKVYSNDGGSIDAQYTNKSTTGCQFNLRWQGGYAGINTSCERLWEVKGMAA